MQNIGLQMDNTSPDSIHKDGLVGQDTIPTWDMRPRCQTTEDGMRKSIVLDDEGVEKAANGCRESVLCSRSKKPELEVFHEGVNVDVLLNAFRMKNVGQYHFHLGDSTHYCVAGRHAIG